MHFPWELLKMYSTISFHLFKACPNFTMISFFDQHYLISNYLRIFQIPFCYLFLINSAGINKDALYDLKPFQLVVIRFEDQNTVCFSECSADTWSGVSFGLFCGWDCWVNLSGNVSWMAGTDGNTRVRCVCSDDFPPCHLWRRGTLPRQDEMSVHATPDTEMRWTPAYYAHTFTSGGETAHTMQGHAEAALARGQPARDCGGLWGDPWLLWENVFDKFAVLLVAGRYSPVDWRPGELRFDQLIGVLTAWEDLPAQWGSKGAQGQDLGALWGSKMPKHHSEILGLTNVTSSQDCFCSMILSVSERGVLKSPT